MTAISARPFELTYQKAWPCGTAEKVVAVRQSWAEKNPEVLAALTRAAAKAADFIDDKF